MISGAYVVWPECGQRLAPRSQCVRTSLVNRQAPLNEVIALQGRSECHGRAVCRSFAAWPRWMAPDRARAVLTGKIGTAVLIDIAIALDMADGLEALSRAINKHKCCIYLEKHNTSVTIHSMNSKQLKKWLEQQGATFQPGKGSHLKVFLNGKQSVLSMHGTAELGKGLEAAIKRQPGLK